MTSCDCSAAYQMLRFGSRAGHAARTCAVRHTQVLLFTATMPDSVAAQSKKWLRRAVRCRAKEETAAQAISSTVVQVFASDAALQSQNNTARSALHTLFNAAYHHGHACPLRGCTPACRGLQPWRCMDVGDGRVWMSYAPHGGMTGSASVRGAQETEEAVEAYDDDQSAINWTAQPATHPGLCKQGVHDCLRCASFPHSTSCLRRPVLERKVHERLTALIMAHTMNAHDRS